LLPGYAFANGVHRKQRVMIRIEKALEARCGTGPLIVEETWGMK
jgi:hypothetical protein